MADHVPVASGRVAFFSFPAQGHPARRADAEALPPWAGRLQATMPLASPHKARACPRRCRDP